MILVGLLLRLIVAAGMYSYHLNPAEDHWRFGWEMGRVGKSLVEGHGFASPCFHPSGPSAWLAPVYPLLVALSFKLFGIYTLGAALFLLTLNSVFGALTVVPIYRISELLFDEDGAKLSGWCWVLLPYSVYIAGGRIWENTLSALIACWLVLLTYYVEREGCWTQWMAWTALWALAALTSPALLAMLPPLALWIVYRSVRFRRAWLLQGFTSAVVFLALVAPWAIRNYETFHRFIPLRDNFWLEMHVGNSGDDRLPIPTGTHPSNSAEEMQQWNRLGEIGYMDAKAAETKLFISEHPGWFIRTTLRRIAYMWTGYWSTSPEYLSAEPFGKPQVVYCTALTVLVLTGLFLARRNGLGEMLTPVALAMFSYPVVYYITHPSLDYRHPIDPLIVVVSSYAIAEFRRVRAVESEPKVVYETAD